MANEYPNIFIMLNNLNEYIQRKEKRQILTNMNIFASKYSNIFEYLLHTGL
jgi:hypothetical protein